MKKPNEIIPLFKVFMSEDVLVPVNKVLMSGFIGQGPRVEEFENDLKKYFGNQYVITTNAATSAEHIALRMLRTPPNSGLDGSEWHGMEDGDEVLTTALTCTATNWPILANGYKIKWVDVDKNTCNMDLKDLERKITSKTKAIVVVHWGGYPNDLDELRNIQDRAQKKYGFKPLIIEDCAHSVGSSYKGKKLGSHGNMCFFSFQAIKHLTTGDGGVLIVPDKKYYDRAKLLRWYGIDREHNSKDFRCESDIPEWGYKFHMNDINATIGIHNLPHLEKVLAGYKANAAYYNQELLGVKGVTLMEHKTDRESSYWLYTLKIERRDDFMQYMKECNIMVSRVHERNDIHSCVKEYRTELPNLDGLVKEMICIPNGWWVTTEQREYIVDCIKKGW
ncbi:MAG TPA: DegT/DnrJ/EryC1/StrS family aminotransferase [Bacteroidia bacterium]|nr:DegT/DnrJ/EryC1/StrS family aminotransferase [Bacteroidia bacterium]